MAASSEISDEFLENEFAKLKERSWRSFSSVSALDRPGGLRALAEMLLVPAGGDVWLGAAGALKRAKITSLSNE